MLVKYWLSTPAVALASGQNIKSARSLMRQHRIHMLPVVSNNHLIGIAFEDDIYNYYNNQSVNMLFDSKQDNEAIDTVMRKDFHKITVDYTMEETAELMLNGKVCSVPVVDNHGHLVGLLTQEDVLNALVNLTGARRQGILYALLVKDQPQSIQVVTDLIRSYGGRLISFLVSSEDVRPEYRKAYIRMYGIDRFKLLSLNEKLSEVAELIYVQDRPEVCRALD